MAAAALAVGALVCGLGVTEVTAREHFSGFRSHSALLAAFPARDRRGDAASLRVRGAEPARRCCWCRCSRCSRCASGCCGDSFRVARHARVVEATGAVGRLSPSLTAGAGVPWSESVNSAPPSGGVGGRDAAAVLLGDLADDREAEAAALARARVGAPVEAVEDVGQVGLGDAVAVIAHADAGLRRPSTSTGPPGAAWRAALSSRLLIARVRRSGSPSRASGSSCATNSTFGLLRRARSSALLGDPVEPDLVHLLGRQCRRAPPRSGRRRALLSSSLCSTTSASRRWRSSSSSSPPASSTSMLVRRLVTGVRSSCEASATSWRWARTDSSSCRARLLEPLEHLVEAGRELADLVVGVDREALAEVVGLADQLGGVRHLRQRARARGGPRSGRARRRARRRAGTRARGSTRRVERTSSTGSAAGRAGPRPET